MNINNKGTIVSVLIILVIVVVGYLLIRSKLSGGGSAQSIDDSVIPSLGIENDPLKNKPNINPAETSNPFRSVKTNPFQ